MSVRRLAPKELQPASFAFTEENLAWAKKQMEKYPPGRQASAVIAIMWRVQEQSGGWVSEAAIRAIADLLDMPYIRVLEVATFTPCSVAAGAAESAFRFAAPRRAGCAAPKT